MTGYLGIGYDHGPRRSATGDLPVVDVYALRHKGALPRFADTVVLSVGGGEKVVVPIDWEPVHFGSFRPWLGCPACSARRRFLHVQGSRVACRGCLDLVYRSRCQRWNSAPPLRRAMRLRRRLGAIEQPFAELPPRPQHNTAARRYDVITREIAACERLALGGTVAVYAALAPHRKGSTLSDLPA